mgnify:CR=1 FL=1
MHAPAHAHIGILEKLVVLCRRYSGYSVMLCYIISTWKVETSCVSREIVLDCVGGESSLYRLA